MPHLDPDAEEFIKFMLAHIIKKGDKTKTITHTLMGPLHPSRPYRGAYNIEGLDYEVFMKLYKKAVNVMDMHIVERPTEVGPIVIDIDFKTHKKHKDRQYLDEHIECVVKKYTNLFKKYLDINVNDLKAFVFEKPSPTWEENKSDWKDGFHIYYPDVPLSVKKRYFFFDKVKKEIIEEDSFSDIPFINTYKDILDSSVISSNGMLMFGSHKENREPYSLTKVYDHNFEIEKTDLYEDDEDDYDLISHFSLRRYTEEDEIPFKSKYENQKKVSSEIDDIFDNYAAKNKKNIKEQNDSDSEDESEEDEEKKVKTKNNKLKKMTNDIEKNYPTENQKDADIKMARMLVKVLSKKRAEDYKDWMCVGWALHSVSPSLFSTYVEFSKRCPKKYEPGCCEKVWEEAKNHNSYSYSIASLHWWARSDNLEDYLATMRDRVKDFIYKAESGTHEDIANVVKEMYKHLYKCVDIKKNMWYEFQEHKWVCVDSAYTLCERISGEVTKEFFVLHSYYLQEAAARESIDQDDSIKKSHKIQRIYDKLKNNSFIKSVVETCGRKFKDDKFEEKLNTNKMLIGFENGVYDLENMCFRRGNPDDMISMTTGYDYIEFKHDDPRVKKIEKFFNQVQMEDDIRGYVLRLISSFLNGEVEDQKFVLWTGSGCHAKNENIMMHDGSIKMIQDISLGENIMGADGRKRRVTATYNGTDKMYNILVKDSSGTTFKVTKKHRLALRCHYRPQIIKEYDDIFDKDIYWVHYHELIENVPMKSEKLFYSEKDATNFINKLASQQYTIEYGSIIPATVESLVYVKYDVLKHYKLFKFGSNDALDQDSPFTLMECNDDEYFGIEVDGDRQYVMGNGYVTYNSNGKSTVIDLIHNTLGDYAGVLPVTVLTRKRGQSGAATPELADKRGKRFLAIQEPEHDEHIYVGLMKELSAGNDKIQARALYGNPFYFKPQFKMILICNRLPPIPASDDGTWRRLRVTPWETKFVDLDYKDKLKANEMKKDPSLTKDIEKWNQPFIWALINKYYPEYKKIGLNEPPKVTQYTNNYKKDSDIYLEFLSEFTERTDNPDDSEQVEYLFKLFTGWYKTAYENKRPAKKEFTGYLTKKGYELTNHGRCIKGIKVITDDGL